MFHVSPKAKWDHFLGSVMVPPPFETRFLLGQLFPCPVDGEGDDDVFTLRKSISTMEKVGKLFFVLEELVEVFIRFTLGECDVAPKPFTEFCWFND